MVQGQTKLIVLSQRVDWENAYQERRDALDQRWAELLNECNLLAVPLANQPDIIPAVLERLHPDGIILTGGATPAIYGGQAPERDKCDEQLIAYALQKQIPLLGICRGMQSLILYFGGSLKQVNGHRAQRHVLHLSDEAVVFMEKPTLAAREVNSYHEWAADNLGDGLLPLLYASDGNVEAMKHKDAPIYGIMWHPEREYPFSPQDLAIVDGVFHSYK